MIAKLIGTLIIGALIWVFYDSKIKISIIEFYHHLLSLRTNYKTERHMDMEILTLQSDTLVKSVEKKIADLHEEYELTSTLISQLDDHLYWLRRECKKINRLGSSGIMKKRFEQLAVSEHEKWNAMEGIGHLQSGISK